MAAPYLTPAQLRARVPTLADPTKYPDVVLADLVAEFEGLAEEYRGVAFTPRSAVETLTIGSGATVIVLSHPRVRSVTSLVVNGITVDTATYKRTELGTIESSSGYAASTFMSSSAVVTYDHGYDVPVEGAATWPGSAGLLRACREYVRICAIADRSSVPREIIATSADGMSNRYSTPNKEQGRPTGYLEIDRLLTSLPDYRYPAVA